MSNPLDTFRTEINNIDEELISLLIKRMKISIKVGEYKKQNKLEILNSNRENEVIERLNLVAKKDKELILDDGLITNLWKIIMDYSKKLQV
tara:strand:- start:209 stop:481 length:273 start_codon:yes stop_codon:yes gene_type:complete